MTRPVLWSSAEAAAAVNGHATSLWDAFGVSIDSRSVRKDDLFVALAGPRFDGHCFVDQALQSGAAAALVSDPPNGTTNESRSLLLVRDTMKALCRLGAAARQRTPARIAAITGSVGKTGTKEALAHVLERQGLTSASRQSFNNHWGVPLSLARMPRDADYGVFEIGMNHAGEITPLVSLVRPHVAVITAIAPAHMAHFDSLDDIARAKAEIFHGLNGGTAIIPRNCDQYGLLADAARRAGAGTIVSFGSHPDSDMRLAAASPHGDGTRVSAFWHNTPIDFRIALPGVHWPVNALAVLAATTALGADMGEAAAALASMPPLSGRGSIHTLRWASGTIRLIDDSYNANPASMRAALETLGRMDAKTGRRIAVLGDMLELGSRSQEEHAGLSTHIERNCIDLVFLAGREIRALEGRLGPERIGGVADDVDALTPLVSDSLAPGDIVTVKASHGIGLTSLVETLLSDRS